MVSLEVSLIRIKMELELNRVELILFGGGLGLSILIWLLLYQF